MKILNKYWQDHDLHFLNCDHEIFLDLKKYDGRKKIDVNGFTKLIMNRYNQTVLTCTGVSDKDFNELAKCVKKLKKFAELKFLSFACRVSIFKGCCTSVFTNNCDLIVYKSFQKKVMKQIK